MAAAADYHHLIGGPGFWRLPCPGPWKVRLQGVAREGEG
jgi:hypothetical protein